MVTLSGALPLIGCQCTPRYKDAADTRFRQKHTIQLAPQQHPPPLQRGSHLAKTQHNMETAEGDDPYPHSSALQLQDARGNQAEWEEELSTIQHHNCVCASERMLVYFSTCWEHICEAGQKN